MNENKINKQTCFAGVGVTKNSHAVILSALSANQRREAAVGAGFLPLRAAGLLSSVIFCDFSVILRGRMAGNPLDPPNLLDSENQIVDEIQLCPLCTSPVEFPVEALCCGTCFWWESWQPSNLHECEKNWILTKQMKRLTFVFSLSPLFMSTKHTIFHLRLIHFDLTVF